jgi:hypothetical protein
VYNLPYYFFHYSGIAPPLPPPPLPRTSMSEIPLHPPLVPTAHPLPKAVLLPMGQAENTASTHTTAKKYINQYLELKEWPSFDNLTLEDVESDHLQSPICSIGYWLANTIFPMKQKTFLSSSSKETYFKNVKEVFKKKFGHSHPLFTNDPQDAWFAALKLHFDLECACHAMLDPEVSVDRTSEPYYRDVTADASIIQAKY